MAFLLCNLYATAQYCETCDEPTMLKHFRLSSEAAKRDAYIGVLQPGSLTLQNDRTIIHCTTNILRRRVSHAAKTLLESTTFHF